MRRKQEICDSSDTTICTPVALTSRRSIIKATATSPVGHHGGTVDVPKPMNRLTGQPEYSGTSIVDVSDPAQPRYLAHVPGLPGESEQGGAQMVRVCDGKALPKADASKTYMLRVFGG